MLRIDENKRMNWIKLEEYAQKDIVTSQSRVLGISRLSQKLSSMPQINPAKQLRPSPTTNLSFHNRTMSPLTSK